MPPAMFGVRELYLTYIVDLRRLWVRILKIRGVSPRCLQINQAAVLGEGPSQG